MTFQQHAKRTMDLLRDEGAEIAPDRIEDVKALMKEGLREMKGRGGGYDPAADAPEQAMKAARFYAASELAPGAAGQRFIADYERALRQWNGAAAREHHRAITAKEMEEEKEKDKTARRPANL